MAAYLELGGYVLLALCACIVIAWDAWVDAHGAESEEQLNERMVNHAQEPGSYEP